jgi:modulator of FtsH protease HflC
MQRILIIGGVLAALAIIVLANAFYIVRIDQSAIVLRFGESQEVINANDSKQGPGLHFKWPIIENVNIYDKRNQGFDLEKQEIIAADQQRLIVDAIARWRIKDPLQFFRAATTQENGIIQLRQRMTAALRGELGKVNQPEIISQQRAQVMQRIRTTLQASMANFGVEIIDVRIRRADLPAENSARVYDRMKAELQQKASRFRGEGESLYTSITADANKQVEVIRAEAYHEAQKLRGEGDSSRNTIYAEAYNKDPEFFSFYRSMQAYEQAVKEGTPIVISPDSDFFKYFSHSDGKR